MRTAFNESRERTRVAATLESYRNAMDIGQIDVVVATFTRDGILDFSGRRYQGSTSIRQGLMHARKRPRRAGEAPRPPSMRHVVLGSDVTFRGPAEAFATTTFAVETPLGIDHRGRYIDRLVRVDGSRWLIAHRQILVDWAATGTALGARSRNRVASGSTAGRVVTTSARRPVVAGGRTRHVY